MDDSGDGFVTNEDSTVGFTAADLLDNDSDVDTGDTVTIVSVDATAGTVGMIVDLGGGNFEYDPDGQFEALGDDESTTDEFSTT